MQAVGAGVLDLHACPCGGRSPRRAKPAMRGASILPLKQRRAGRSVAALRADQDRLCRVERERWRGRARLALVVDGEGALQGLLADAQHAGRGIGAGPDAIPERDAQLLAGRRRARRRISSAMPSGVSTSAKPAPVAAIAARDHGLRPVLRQGRPDQRLDGKRGGQRHVARRPRSAHRSRARHAAGARRSGRRTGRIGPRASGRRRRDWDRRARCAPAWR